MGDEQRSKRKDWKERKEQGRELQKEAVWLSRMTVTPPLCREG